MKTSSHPQAQEYLEPTHSLGYLCRINFREFSKALEKLTLPYGISAGQWRFLRVLWQRDNLTQRELSQRVGTREATTVRSVRKLEAAGLVVRRPSENDRRKVFVRLTPKARRLEHQLMPMVAEVNEMALTDISAADIETARRVLTQAYANLKQDQFPHE